MSGCFTAKARNDTPGQMPPLATATRSPFERRHRHNTGPLPSFLVRLASRKRFTGSRLFAPHRSRNIRDVWHRALGIPAIGRNCQDWSTPITRLDSNTAIDLKANRPMTSIRLPIGGSTSPCRVRPQTEAPRARRPCSAAYVGIIAGTSYRRAAALNSAAISARKCSGTSSSTVAACPSSKLRSASEGVSVAVSTKPPGSSVIR